MSELLGIGSRVKHPAFGDGVIVGIDVMAYKVSFITYGIKDVGKVYDKWEIIEKIEPIGGVTFSDAEQSLIKILRLYNAVDEVVDLGVKWIGGTMILKPKDEELKPKEIPLEQFFHKIVMVRDRVRVMEQRINSSDLNDEEKVNLQQYITRIYGSLTTFNILFKNKDDQFKGESSK